MRGICRGISRLSERRKNELEPLIPKGGKGYRITHAHILLKRNESAENEEWPYERIVDAYGVCRATIAGVANRFVMDGPEAALGRKAQQNHARKVTGEAEAKIGMIACSDPPEGSDRWTMQMIADKLIQMHVVDYIADSTVCNTMKKTNSNRGWSRNGAFRKRTRSL